MDKFSRNRTNDKSKDREEIQHPKPGDTAELDTHRKHDQHLIQWTQDSHKLDRALTMVVSSQYTPKELSDLVGSIPTSDLTRPHPTNGPENTKPLELRKEIASAIVENFTQKMNQRKQEQAINAIDSTGGNLNKAHSTETDRANEQRNMEKQPSTFRADAEAFARNPIQSKTEVQAFMMQGTNSSGFDYNAWRQGRITAIQAHRNRYPGYSFSETVEQEVDREYQEWCYSQQQASQASTSYSNPSDTQARDQQQQPQQYRDSSAPSYGQSGSGIYHAPGDELKLKEAAWDIKRASDGTEGKYRKLKPTIDDYDCHTLTFRDGRPGDKIPLSYIEKDFQLWGSKDHFHNDDSLYGVLFENLTKDEGKYKNHYIAIYRVNGKPIHSSPIEKVYQKEDGEYSIELWGKWGKNGYLVAHDIEVVPDTYKDKRKTNWEIRFTSRENGRIMDL